MTSQIVFYSHYLYFCSVYCQYLENVSFYVAFDLQFSKKVVLSIALLLSLWFGIKLLLFEITINLWVYGLIFNGIDYCLRIDYLDTHLILHLLMLYFKVSSSRLLSSSDSTF